MAGAVREVALVAVMVAVVVEEADLKVAVFWSWWRLHSYSFCDTFVQSCAIHLTLSFPYTVCRILKCDNLAQHKMLQ